jgi:hypothetical protein
MTTSNAGIRSAALVCALAVLTSCTGAGGSVAVAGAALPPGAAAVLGSGTLYLDAGNSAFSANLWRIDLPSGHAAQLTRNREQDGISNFSASPAGLVMGDAASTVDVLDRLWHGKAIQVGDGSGNAPVINDAGQVAYELDPPGSGAGVYRILLRDSVTGPPRTIFRESRFENLGISGWSPDGRELLIWESPDNESYTPQNKAYTKYVAITTGGRVVWQLTKNGDGDVRWAAAGLSLGNGTFGPGPNQILTLSGKVEYSIPGGWEPFCWNPAGTEVIAFRHPDDLGLWRLSAPGRVQDLGALPLGGLLECQWLSSPATGT